jgi:hypothetical protein
VAIAITSIRAISSMPSIRPPTATSSGSTYFDLKK